jgi:chitosanase
MKINKYLMWFLALFLLVVVVTVMSTRDREYPFNGQPIEKNETFNSSEVYTEESVTTSNMKNVILQMTATLENSDTQLHFNYAENLGDERGITFGCVGFCTGTYDGNILIKHYTELNPDNTLAKYIPALDKIDAGPHNAASGDGNPSTKGLDGFIEDVQNCNDPLFKKAQMDKLDEFYYNPAMKLADSIGAKNALTKAFIYDMCVRHGVDQTEGIIKGAGTTPKQGADENTYLLKLISLRDAKLKQEDIGDVDRDQGYKKVLNSGNVNLKTPFKFDAYDDYFTIDGKLDL